jgi:hypothetical protein
MKKYTRVKCSTIIHSAKVIVEKITISVNAPPRTFSINMILLNGERGGFPRPSAHHSKSVADSDLGASDEVSESSMP